MPHPLSKSLALFLAAALAAAVGAPAARAAGDAATRTGALNALLAEQWQWQLQQSPEFASAIGDYRYNDRWSDISLAHVAMQKQDTERFLARFRSIDTTGFAEQDRLNQQLMVRQLQDSLRAIALKTYEMPLDQFTGVHLQLAQFVAILPFDSTRHYEDYVARLDQVPALFDQLIGVLKQGEKDGLMPPKFLLEKVVTQCRAIAAPAGEASAFGQPVAKFPDGVPVADRARLHDAVIEAVDGKVRPAYLKLADFVEKEYAPKGRAGLGLWALPDGGKRYRFAIEQMTTTDLAPAKIHALGLSEVARIEAEQDAIAKKLGYKDLAAFRAGLKTDPKIRPTSREQILDLYRKYIAQMEPKLPQLFGLLPKAKLEVLPVETFREKEASAAQYTTGTPDGSRPGKVWVNTGDFEHRNLLEIESTAYHEGVPGHHMQLSIAQELPSLPPFRQQAGYTAYVEGWALYSERLGKEVGFYTDPYSDYGRLCDELLRADRLVLDTGVHAMRWTREQMVDYFRTHSCETEPDIQAETDRYIAWPAQALAYKLGQMKFLELRARARKELGDKFDIRAFHDEMLDGGALPLDVLDARTNAWIAAVKAGKARAHPAAAR
ncbi:MAG: DUF885 domain-containing protein [Mizugakiibacter sp.]|uniref:DUF885 domain-containing protein n=1 Tax=Mizugakiibacter sp. TaxID=1972610 RepID=UPI0031C8126B|nr:DUF885 domain-containing protein [Xanthomonadaceae bacterium]